MIIFTVKNQVSGQIYVGYTRSNLQEQWQKIINAAEENLDFPLYREIRAHGVELFSVDEYDYAETRDEVKEVEDEVIRLYNAKSLRGYKTSNLIIKKKTRKRATSKKEDKALKKLFVVNPLTDPDIDDALILEGVENAQPSKQTIPATEPSGDKAGRVIKRTEKGLSANSSSVPNIKDHAITGPSSLNSSNLEEKALSTNTAVDTAAEIPAPDTEHWGNNHATIQTGPTAIDKSLSNQLDVIQAAANALFSGDTQVAQQLTQISRVATPSSAEAEKTLIKQETPIALTPFQQKITAAIARERTKRASRNSTEANSLREALQAQLSQLREKANQMKSA